jgi:hypothetical protein
MTPEEYEAKKAARIERLRARSERATRAANAAISRSREIGSHIPMGQPILVGHHSEKRHRRDIARIDAGMRKGFALAEEAKALARRAEHAESSTAVSSDDPAAVSKLREKLASLETSQARMKAGNAAIRRKASIPEIARVTGLSEANAAKLLEKDFAGRIGFPPYALTNTSSEVRRVKARIAELEKRTTSPARGAETIGEVRIDEAENRVRLHFPGKPDEKTRKGLKSAGFRWSPTVGAWQRMASPGAWYAAREVATRALEAGRPPPFVPVFVSEPEPLPAPVPAPVPVPTPAPQKRGFTYIDEHGHKILRLSTEAPSFSSESARQRSYAESEELARDMTAHEAEDIAFREGRRGRDVRYTPTTLTSSIARAGETAEIERRARKHAHEARIEKLRFTASARGDAPGSFIDYTEQEGRGVRDIVGRVDWDPRFKARAVQVRANYTSDGAYQGEGRGKLVAERTREGKWLVEGFTFDAPSSAKALHAPPHVPPPPREREHAPTIAAPTVREIPAVKRIQAPRVPKVPGKRRKREPSRQMGLFGNGGSKNGNGNGKKKKPTESEAAALARLNRAMGVFGKR